MSKIQKIQKIRKILTIALLALLPFHALIATTGAYYLSGFNFFRVLLAWKEIITIGIIGLCTIEIIGALGGQTSIQKIKTLLKVDFLDGILLSYMVLAGAFLLFQESSIGQWAHGVRISVLPFALLFFARKVSWSNSAQIIKTALIVGLIVSILGILQALILPESWLGALGYAQNVITEVPGAGRIVTGVTSNALQACPPLEHTSQFCRAISTFGGPTRFGVYLLAIIGLGLAVPMRRNFRIPVVGFALFAAILTYSRSVWLGLIALLCVFAWLKLGKKALIVGAVSVLVVGSLGVFAWNMRSGEQHLNPLKSIFARVSSTEKHFLYLKNGVTAVAENPLGRGLGTAGPASMRYEPFLTENWFLQIAVEMGVLGGALFLAFMGGLLWRLYKIKTPLSFAVLMGLIGICVAGLVTHSFEELAASYTMMVLGGIAVGGEHEQNQ